MPERNKEEESIKNMRKKNPKSPKIKMSKK